MRFAVPFECDWYACTLCLQRAGFAVTRRTHERKQLASELRTALVPKSIRAATSVPAAPAIEQNDTWHQATARGVTEVNAAAEHKRAASPKAAAPANKCRNFRRWSPDQVRTILLVCLNIS